MMDFEILPIFSFLIHAILGQKGSQHLGSFEFLNSCCVKGAKKSAGGFPFFSRVLHRWPLRWSKQMTSILLCFQDGLILRWKMFWKQLAKLLSHLLLHFNDHPRAFLLIHLNGPARENPFRALQPRARIIIEQMKVNAHCAWSFNLTWQSWHWISRSYVWLGDVCVSKAFLS